MRINPDKYLSKGKQQAVSALGMLGLGIMVIAGANSYIPSNVAGSEQAAAPVETTKASSAPLPEESTQAAPVETEMTEPADSDSPVRLNLAFLDSQGLKIENSADSVAGQVYQVLSEKDSAWIADIYGMMNSSPKDLAARLGKSPALVTGLFDSDNETHLSDHPDSWIIPTWTKTNVTFYDGDGAVISGYSNTKEILSMVSVYAHWNNISEVEQIRQYAEVLWSVSHDYSVQMSDIYYCEGCGDETGDENFGGEAVLTSEEQAAEVEPSAETETTSRTLATPSTAAYSIEDVPEGWESIAGPQRDVWAAVVAAHAKEEAVSEESEAASAAVTPCTGHIDLNIMAQISGLDDSEGLYAKDAVGNQEAGSNETWKGWDDYNRLYAKCLRQQDWYSEYGLSVTSSLYIRNPLSSSEIKAYMDMLPAETSAKRRSVIETALQSVGRIPYYWGGKPYRAGFDGNNFGNVTTPDENGRSLRGLDCSGWVNWVYWSALGSRLPAESTSGLINCGTGIQRSELQPGDIIIMTGDDAHVFMFMAWAGDDHMYLIHETGGITNNVTVSRYRIYWPGYRSLINQ